MKSLTNIAYAELYISKKLNNTSWLEADLQTQNALLHEATARIYAIQGVKYTPELVELLTEVPDDLQQACCEVALSLSRLDSNNPHIDNQNLGIKSISFGQDSVSYDKNIENELMPNYIFSPYAQSILNKYIFKGFKYV